MSSTALSSRTVLRAAEESSSDDDSSEDESSQVGEEEDDQNEPGPTCGIYDEAYKGRKFGHVFDREEAFLKHHRGLREASFGSAAHKHGPGDQRFSVALSGGGVRAAAFAAGVVWHLAERGQLKDVDYISAVSGGSYIAAALATHIAALWEEEEAPPPQRGLELDAWYRRAVARTLCRMQANTPYLARDLGKEPFSAPDDGSSCLPRVFDIPIMVGVLSFAMLIRTLLLFLMVIFPLVELIEISYGADMRMTFCADVFAPRLIFVTLLGPSPLGLNIGVVLLIVFTVFVLHVMLVIMRTHEHERGRWGTCCWLSLRSVLSVGMRGLVLWLVLTGLISGPVAWRFHRYQAVGATYLRTCQCRDFMLNAARLPCADRVWQDSQGSAAELRRKFGYLDYLRDHTICRNLTTPAFAGVVLGAQEAPAQDFQNQHPDDPSDVFPDLFSRRLMESLFPQMMLLLLAALALAFLLMPFLPEAFAWVFNIAGPLVLFFATFFLVQWRVLGLVTNERLFSFGDSATRQARRWWPAITKSILLLDMLLVCLLKYLKSAAHVFYARSMRKAFYAGGRDWTWGEIRQAPQCPYLIFCTTVNDYMRLGDDMPHAEFAFGTLYTGGDRTGFRRTWSGLSVAKCSALSGGALDGFILGFHDSLSFRFWLEFLGVHMGNFVRFRRSRAPSAVAKLPGIVWFVIVYGLLLVGVCMADHGALHECRKAGKLFDAASVCGVVLITFSFFDFITCLAPLHHSAVLRGVHQASQFYHQSDQPPSVVYITDGGVLDNTGIVQLLRRRCRRILSVYAEEDSDDVFGSLKEVFRIAEKERLGSFYNPEDPRRSVWHTVLEYLAHPDWTYLHLCIRYGASGRDEGQGQLWLVKNRLPPSLGAEPVRGLLSEDEVLGRTPQAGPDGRLGRLRQADLGGCCCDGCHATACNLCCGRFPAPPTANQWLTPQMFSSLCRLGRAVSSTALAAADAGAASAA